ncbi:MgtC/SapB family protein [Brevibacterium sp. 5221]|uniref:MgtC/SapB family protein n=1 Tax=Brevibacterium rongguiense TaxID=2695267 RepID=A0A6N9H3X1_9MICO|nr:MULTISPECIES: MgtC/SapB family protein [Brevibacterium]MYM18748.1 MgtC/SapB family protein [Brevibacterium rongguiense]WAL40238.1 MgtC/SapB family protein [Brevibacterium sp. BRM-1]
MNLETIFAGQGLTQVLELLLAFALSSLVGFERQLRGKSAGMRTQAIVGTASALFMLVSKYGFFSVLSDEIVLDPSRVAAQIVSGVGFLGAGLILTNRGTVRGLTTAASVWETAAIGMAAGAGLWLLAVLVTALHFVVGFGFGPLASRLLGRRSAVVRIDVEYTDGQGLLRAILQAITSRGWAISSASPDRSDDGIVRLTLEVSGRMDLDALLSRLAELPGVSRVARADDEDE